MPTLLYSLADAFLTDCCKAVKGTALVGHTVSKHMAQQVQVWRPGQSPSAPPTDKAVHPSAAFRAVHVLRAPLRDDRRPLLAEHQQLLLLLQEVSQPPARLLPGLCPGCR